MFVILELSNKWQVLSPNVGRRTISLLTNKVRSLFFVDLVVEYESRVSLSDRANIKEMNHYRIIYYIE